MHECRKCGSTELVRNGHIKSGKQQWLCKQCGSCRVESPQVRRISEDTKEKLRRALCERCSLRGICRIFEIGLTWLLSFAQKEYASVPETLPVALPMTPERQMEIRLCEADELWSFVSSKEKTAWIWLLMDVETRQIVACHVGGRTRKDAMALWANVPHEYQDNCFVFTDFLKSYEKAIPGSRHAAVGKDTGFTNHIERFNCTLRQRLSRLVRKSLSFSKKMEYHIGAIRYFLFQYNQEIVFPS